MLFLLVGCNSELVVKANDSVPTKVEYLKKLNEIEEDLKEFEEVYEKGTQIEMNEAMAETFKRWDNALNEIYGTLEQQLPTKEMNELSKNQQKWIQTRDEEAKKEASKYEGGSLQPFVYSSTQAEISKKRCYELVEKYMR